MNCGCVRVEARRRRARRRGAASRRRARDARRTRGSTAAAIRPGRRGARRPRRRRATRPTAMQPAARPSADRRPGRGCGRLPAAARPALRPSCAALCANASASPTSTSIGSAKTSVDVKRGVEAEAVGHDERDERDGRERGRGAGPLGDADEHERQRQHREIRLRACPCAITPPQANSTNANSGIDELGAQRVTLPRNQDRGRAEHRRDARDPADRRRRVKAGTHMSTASASRPPTRNTRAATLGASTSESTSRKNRRSSRARAGSVAAHLRPDRRQRFPPQKYLRPTRSSARGRADLSRNSKSGRGDNFLNPVRRRRFWPHPYNRHPMAGLFDIAGKSALVTGGSRGIGLMIARGYVEAGARSTSRRARPRCATRSRPSCRSSGPA